MIFPSKEAVIYLKRQGLEVYFSGKTPLVFKFSADLVSAEEIKNKEKFRSQLADFLTASKLAKLQAVIVLAEELIYQKNISAADLSGVNAEREKFLAEIPFPAEKIVSKTFTDKKLFMAVNQELFNILINVISENGGKISLVIPITLLGIPAIDNNNYRKIIRNKNRLKQFDLSGAQIAKKNNNLQLVLIMIFIIVALLSGAGIYYLTAGKTPAQKTQNIESVADPKKISVTAVPQKQREDLTIKVLNGTGTAGDAKKVQDALEALGFQNIEIDNIEAQDAVNSIVSYTSSAASYVPEIETALQKIFNLEPELVATDNISSDLQIITGK